MFIVKIQGGLGNQISQYAFSRLLKERFPLAEVKLDISWYTNHFDRDLELFSSFDNTNMVYDIATACEIWKTARIPIRIDSKKGLLFALLSKIIHFVFKRRYARNVLVERVSSGYPQMRELVELDDSKDLYFDGTWHSVDYSQILCILKNELSFNCTPQTIEEERSVPIGDNSVGIHFRFGDYVDSKWDILGSSNYYVNAIEMTKNPENNYVIFSDNIGMAKEWWRNHFDMKIAFFVDINDREGYFDMMIMSKMNTLICANSTYSYWAGMIGYEEGKEIIIPAMYSKGCRMWKNKLFKTVELT